MQVHVALSETHKTTLRDAYCDLLRYGYQRHPSQNDRATNHTISFWVDQL